MSAHRHAWVALLVLGATTAWGRAALDPAGPCAAKKLNAAARMLRARSGCELNAATRLAECRARVERGLERSFAATEKVGSCLLQGDADAAADAVGAFVDAELAQIQPAGGPSRCTRLALVATAKLAKSLLRARAKDVVAPDPIVLAGAGDAARVDFTTRMAKALEAGDCGANADPAALADAAVEFADGLRALLLPPLRALGARTGRRIGAAVQSGYLANEPDYVATLVRELDAMTAEFEALWTVLHPAPAVYAFDALDAIADFAAAHGMLLRAHHLVWDLYYPDYLNALSPEELRIELEDHIRTVAGRYRGRIATWVVVNEAVNYFSAGLKPSIWLDKLGPDYIADAFRIAHEADPDAELFYNDVFAENVGPKSDFIYAMVQDLIAQGVPIHGVGFQMHHFFGGPAPATLRQNLQRFVDLGLRVQLTEIDVLTGSFPGELADRLREQATVYHDIVAVCVAVAGCDAMTFWGFTDKHSWIDTFFAPNLYPLPFDTAYRPKPAYLGVRDALLGR